jgi:hypothetical protein
MQYILLIIFILYIALVFYSIFWITKSLYLDKKQKKANIILIIFFPIWIFILKEILKPLKKKATDDRGWVRQEGEGSVAGTWTGAFFNH